MLPKAHILIIDDDANTLASLARAFRLANHEATVCDNAARALELAKAERSETRTRRRIKVRSRERVVRASGGVRWRPAIEREIRAQNGDRIKPILVLDRGPIRLHEGVLHAGDGAARLLAAPRKGLCTHAVSQRPYRVPARSG